MLCALLHQAVIDGELTLRSSRPRTDCLISWSGEWLDVAGSIPLAHDATRFCFRLGQLTHQHGSRHMRNRFPGKPMQPKNLMIAGYDPLHFQLHTDAPSAV